MMGRGEVGDETLVAAAHNTEECSHCLKMKAYAEAAATVLEFYLAAGEWSFPLTPTTHAELKITGPHGWRQLQDVSRLIAAHASVLRARELTPEPPK